MISKYSPHRLDIDKKCEVEMNAREHQADEVLYTCTSVYFMTILNILMIKLSLYCGWNCKTIRLDKLKRRQLAYLYFLIIEHSRSDLTAADFGGDKYPETITEASMAGNTGIATHSRLTAVDYPLDAG